MTAVETTTVAGLDDWVETADQGGLR